MIPLGETTAVLPQIEGHAVKKRGFSLTLLQTVPQLSAVCVSSPIHSTPSPVLRKIHSRSQRRINSVSSTCRETKLQGEQVLSKRHSPEDLRVESIKVQTMAPQQMYPNCLITMTSEKETISSLESKKEQSIDFSQSSCSHVDSQSPSPSEVKNLPKLKNKKGTSRTIKSSKSKSRKLSKSRKSCKKRNGIKFSSKKPSVFERLTNSTFKSHNYQEKEKLNKESPNTKKDTTIVFTNQTCGTLLEIRRLQATYNPERNAKPKTFLLFPKVPKLKNTAKNSPRTTYTVKNGHKNPKLNSCNSALDSPRPILDTNFKNKENTISCKKIYLSEMQSKAIGGIPSAPPGTPSLDQLQKVEYIPSLMDVKSQRAVKSKLEKIVNKLRIEEQHRKEYSMKQDQKKIKESLIQLRQRQRIEIYALNKVMTELENENFKNFMEKKEAVSLGV